MWKCFQNHYGLPTVVFLSHNMQPSMISQWLIATKMATTTGAPDLVTVPRWQYTLIRALNLSSWYNPAHQLLGSCVRSSHAMRALKNLSESKETHLASSTEDLGDNLRKPLICNLYTRIQR
jgi:hypothetical protein